MFFRDFPHKTKQKQTESFCDLSFGVKIYIFIMKQAHAKLAPTKPTQNATEQSTMAEGLRFMVKLVDFRSQSFRIGGEGNLF